MYRFVPYAEWVATDAEGNRTCALYHKYPFAVVNYEQTEVVVTCNCPEDGGTHTQEEAQERIKTTWVKPDIEVI